MEAVIKKLKGGAGERRLSDQYQGKVNNIFLQLSKITEKKARLYENLVEGLIEEEEYQFAKEYLDVLDFIGNYEKAGSVRYLLTGSSKLERGSYDPADRSDIPDDCQIDFDMKLIDLFSEMDKKRLKLKDKIVNEYFRVKDLLEKAPSRLELFTYMEDDVYQMAVTHSKENPFKRYLDFKNGINELSDDEKEIYHGIGNEFISLIENTSMSKVYKMPVLMAFYNHGKVLMQVNEQQLLDSWKEFFSTGTNWKDLESEISYERFIAISDKEHIKKIIQMPVHFLLESGKGFFIKKDGCVLALRDELKDVVGNPVFVEQMKDVIDYRTMDYYQRRYRNENGIV